jgi:peptidoglycan hydrolase-like amidase
MRQRAVRNALWSALGGLLVPVGIVTLGVATPSAAQASSVVNEVFTRPASGSFAVQGHGWGHGHGMSQYGAQGAAKIGKTADQITATYYPGTGRAVQANTSIRVKLSFDTRTTVREFIPSSGQVMKDLSTGATVSSLPTSALRWRVKSDSSGLRVQYDTSSGTTTLSRTYAGPLQVSGTTYIRVRASNGTSRDYRTSVRVLRYGSASLESIAVMSMESYLYGVVPRESLSSWPAAALQAQAIAARSYSTYKRDHVSSSKTFDICDTTQCQVFMGSAKYTSSGTRTSLEPSSTTAAVKATAGVIRTYGGKAIFSEYNASNGGWSTAGSTPYLVAKEDPWDGITGSTSHAWTATLPVSALEKRYGPVDAQGNPLWRFSRLTITERDGNGEWGGRILAAKVTLIDGSGTARVMDASGSGLYASHTWPANSGGLRSRWWRVVPNYGATLVSRSAAPTLVQPPGKATGSVTASLKNAGTSSWPVSGLHLALASPAGGADPLAGGATRPGVFVRNVSSPGATSVVPGQTAEFRISFDASSLPTGVRTTSYRLRIGTASVFGPTVTWSVPIVAPVFSAVPANPPALVGTTLPARTGAPEALFADGRTVVVPRDGSSTVRLSVRNTGNLDWPSGATTPVMLGTSAPRDRRSVSFGEGWASNVRAGRLLQSAPVPPRQVGTFDVVLHGNDQPAGVTSEAFEPAWNGRAWIGGAQTTLSVVRVDTTRYRLAAVNLAPRATLTLVKAPTGRADLVVRMRNLGGEPWTVGQEGLKASGATGLAYNWPSSTQAPPLSRNVSRPGATAVFPGEIGQWTVPIWGAKMPLGTSTLTLRLATPKGTAYGPTLSTTVKVVAADFAYRVTYVKGSVSVPSDGEATTGFIVRNNSNFSWPVNHKLRSTVPSGSSPSRAERWYSASRPGSLTRNYYNRSSKYVRPGEYAVFLVRLAGNGRSPRTTSEVFGMSWDGWRSTPLRVTLSYRVV